MACRLGVIGLLLAASLAAAGAYEALVCRYAPNGNIDGRRVP